MSFVSFEFVILFCATALLFQLVKGRAGKQSVLLGASYIFYAYWDIRFLGLLIFLTWVSYWLSGKISDTESLGRKKWYCALGITVSLGILAFFKYSNFFISVAAGLFRIHRDNIWNVILPIGISFYTFQAISYLVDVYRGRIEGGKSFLEVSLYISFFPQLVAGPIVRAADFFPQLEEGRTITSENVEIGIQIFLLGLLKKVVVADRLAVCVDAVFEAPIAYDRASVICAVVAYSMQIYCDFSGYSDMAVGVARFFGYNLCRNFNLPYISKNPTEFWRRWHISLSTWLRDYLYVPLGGNRRGKARTYVNLLLTMLLGGLWHGASWNFVLWGVMHGVLLAVHKIFCQGKRRFFLECHNRNLKTLLNAVSMLITYCFICTGWILFRAQTVYDAGVILQKIFLGSGGIHYIYVYTIIFGLILLAVQLFILIKNGGDGRYPLVDLKTFGGKLVLCLEALVICVFSYVGDTAFVYFQF